MSQQARLGVVGGQLSLCSGDRTRESLYQCYRSKLRKFDGIADGIKEGGVYERSYRHWVCSVCR